MKPDVHSAVSFSRLNLLDDACMLFITGVDLILCCNVLIYFDAISKKKGDSALLHQLIEKIEAAANSPLARQLHVVSLPALLVSEPPPLDEFQTIPTNRRLGHFYQWPESLARTSAATARRHSGGNDCCPTHASGIYCCVGQATEFAF